MDVLSFIKIIISEFDGIKARELTRLLNKRYNLEVDKSRINSILYSHKNYFIVDENMNWHINTESDIINPEQTTKETNKSNVENIELFEITGSVVNIFEVKTGIFKNRIWKLQNFIIKTKNKQSEILFSDWKGLVEANSLKLYDNVIVVFDIKSKRQNVGLLKNYLNVIKLQKLN